MNIGILIVATGKYDQFVWPLIHSLEENFLPGHVKNFFVFTDPGNIGTVCNGHFVDMNDQTSIHTIFVSKYDWPYSTALRYKMYVENEQYYKDMDYVFAMDADMLVVGSVCDEILGDTVAVKHPGFYNKAIRKFTYEKNPKSKAFVTPGVGRLYYAGGLVGGSAVKFSQIAKTVHLNLQLDSAESIMAVWHDESHINHYFAYNPPAVILNPGYCWPEEKQCPFEKKIVALKKNHKELQK